MTGNEFLERIRTYAKRHELPFDFDPAAGKGSHGLVRLGRRQTRLKDRRKEIGKGLLSKMCRDLDISVHDLFRSLIGVSYAGLRLSRSPEAR